MKTGRVIILCLMAFSFINAEPSIPLNAEFGIPLNAELGLNPIKKWAFNRKTKKRARYFATGQRIKVKYNGVNKRGKLRGITKDNLLLESKRDGLLKIDKRWIEKISLLNEKNILLGLFGWLVTIVAIVMFFVSFMVYVITPIDSPSNPQTKKKGKKSFLYALLMLLGGFIMYNIPKLNTVIEPFDGNWEITEIQQSDSSKMDELKHYLP